MGVSARPISFLIAVCTMGAVCLRADEIRLKDGKKLNGVIVGYEQNMFRVKTDFGYVLVEKDKIAAIIPEGEAQDAAKNAAAAAKAGAPPKTDLTTAPPAKAEAAKLDTSAKTRIPTAVVKPSLPLTSPKTDAVPPAFKGGPAALPATAAPLMAAAGPEVPGIREAVQGNVYVNQTHGFRMYKAPSWQLIDDARSNLPNAIVAMGTSNQSTLMIVGREKTKEPLDAAALTVEKRLHEVYEPYQRIAQRKVTVGGSPAVEFRYVGKADDHDWSGTLVVISRGGDIFTVLGMTYADNDLIQIQENVIAKAIASISFETVEAKK